ncbi:pirin family protein [Paenibacillus qinlingensis]|uniref:Redox-sensitive bicupin YhaK (Pirin superfamily) n=1 Tax=Paenibacillus qinlingensis TaxID=1837343 RepID=A0ABU1NRF4_9BACL|nr:pirin family protein [Paenibacillus qinlingensis]MDR6550059.1 redox-sensitive bicupin YhaK (pirin superfamily) [Paenibacillus qinlingensis]
MNIQILGPEYQGKEEFDRGKIRAQKPLGFSGQGAVTVRLGPLFYWAWGQAASAGGVGFHPHQGFEILSYGIAGQGLHRDTLGTESTMQAGDIQLMQAGSGMQHAESVEAGFESFQIWLEPYLNDAVRREPTYSLYKHEQFPQTRQAGVNIKTILGDGSPVQQLVADARMVDVEVEAGASYVHKLLPNRTLAGLAIRGQGGSLTSIGQAPVQFKNRDFAIVQSDEEADIRIQAENETLRIFLIEVPTEVDYPLYNKAR